MPGYRKSVPVDYISGRTRASKEQPASKEQQQEQQPEPHPEPQPEQPPEPQPEPQLVQQPEPQLEQQPEPQLEQHPAPHPEQQPEQQIVDLVDLVEDFLPPPPPELISSKMSSGGINLKKYNGSESPLIWLSTLQSWQDFHNLSDARTMAAMSFNMEGAAALWLQGLSGEDKTDFIKFKELFITRFGQKASDNKFFGTKQQPDENGDRYLERIEKLALGHNLPECSKVQVAMNGLHSKIKSKVLGKEPTTFMDLRHYVDLAKEELACCSDSDNINIVSVSKLCDEIVTKLQTDFKEKLEGVQQEVSAIAAKHPGKSQHQFKTFQKQHESQPFQPQQQQQFHLQQPYQPQQQHFHLQQQYQPQQQPFHLQQPYQSFQPQQQQ
ncbi:uncharacterized protein LOC132559726 [Ylistrum balloti]|uniref:uncharacterized protein LOC132559726 n=1 Tax=Ylistrum balloti TaxID=509963 RepID=UPI002905810B|nr:uncharacterized protein LOC132559726 [Ylistrum balloti]